MEPALRQAVEHMKNTYQISNATASAQSSSHGEKPPKPTSKMQTVEEMKSELVQMKKLGFDIETYVIPKEGGELAIFRIVDMDEN